MSTALAAAELGAGLAEPAVRPGRVRLAGMVVLGTWAVCTAVAVALVVRFGRTVPYSDDWQLLPYESGRKPVTGSWLWHQHNEHRIPLVKALHVVLLRTFHLDFRATTMANVLALSLVALGLILAARRLRGEARLVDVAIPLLVLSPQVPALQWGVQAQFTATAVALCLVLVVAARRREPRTLPARDVVVWVGALFLLATSGLNGVAVLPVVAGTLLIRAVRARSAAIGARVGAVAASAMALSVVPLYFVHFQPTAHDWGHPGPAQLATVATRLVASPLGPGVERRWPLAGLAVVGIGTLTIVAARRRPVRPPALFMVVLGAEVLVAGAVAFGRGGQPWGPGLSNHYSTLFLPLIGVLVLSWGPARDGATRAALAVGLAGLVMLYASATADAVHQGRWVAAAEQSFRRDVQAGVPAEVIVDRHIGLLYFVDSAETRRIVADGLPALLCATGLGTCTGAAPTP